MGKAGRHWFTVLIDHGDDPTDEDKYRYAFIDVLATNADHAAFDVVRSSIARFEILAVYAKSLAVRRSLRHGQADI